MAIKSKPQPVVTGGRLLRLPVGRLLVKCAWPEHVHRFPSRAEMTKMEMHRRFGGRSGITCGERDFEAVSGVGGQSFHPSTSFCSGEGMGKRKDG